LLGRLLETRQDSLSARLSEAPQDVPDSHPGIAETYRRRIERLTAAHEHSDDAAEAAEAIREIIDRIVIAPGPTRRDFTVTLQGELGAILDWIERTANTGYKPAIDIPSSRVSASVNTGACPIGLFSASHNECRVEFARPWTRWQDSWTVGSAHESARGSGQMAITRKEEARALNADERELVEKSHHPALQELPDTELSDLVKLMRERRGKAKAQADRRRREMRGKAAPKGATPSASDEGSRLKLDVLAMAMRRLNAEAERRRGMAARAAQVGNAQKALAMKQAEGKKGSEFNSRHAREGMRKAESGGGQKLVRPMERGRQRKAASVAQAKRDSR
jgi:hypothetical protein